MDEYRILVVANKYLTGYDQPKLTAMYVDKKLQGVIAVQALSRLNRSSDKLGKKTEDLFILDFYNTTEDIKHFCTECGIKTKSKYKFCPSCGNKL